jgi:hypothetical protein
VTAVVVREDGYWMISSWIDARLEVGGDFQTLDELVQTADALVRDSYPTKRARETAELQYAIYPWSAHGAPQAMLDIKGDTGNLVATDIQGSGLEIHGLTAEDLVTEAAARIGDTPSAMFRWIKKIAELRSEATG